MSMIQDAFQMLKSIRDQGHESVIASFSGGKDSVAVLDMASQVFPEVHAYFLYLVKGLEIEESVLRRAEAKYGIKIHRLPNANLAMRLREADYLYQPVYLRRDFKLLDIERVMRARTGAKFILYGHRMDESLERRGMLKAGQGLIVNAAARRWKAYPLWNWNSKSVYAYLRHRKIDFWVRTNGEDTGGVGMTPDRLLYLKQHHPADFAKIAEAFPLVEAGVMRAKLLEAV